MQNRRLPKLLAACFLYALPALIFLMVNIYWMQQTQGPYYSLGYLQGDQTTYTAFARAVFDRGNGLIYSNPFDYRVEAPRVLSNLGYLGLGWLLRAVGGREIWMWEIWRIGWGMACFGLFAMIVMQVTHSRFLRGWGLIVGSFGGGAAWIYMLSMLPTGRWDLLFPAFAHAEQDYLWWLLNLFRQALYPLELFYHALFFGLLLLYLKKRHGLLLLVFFLTWWAHVVTALLATTVIGLALFVEWRREKCRRSLFTLCGMALISALWVAYWKIYLVQFPSIASWMQQSVGFDFPLNLSVWPRAWGPWLIALPFAFLYRPLRHFLLNDRLGILLVSWAVAVLFWTHHERITPFNLQPMHFTRGYFFLILVLILIKAIDLKRSENGNKSKSIKIGKKLLVILLPLLLFDNLLFVGYLCYRQPQQGLLSITKEQQNILTFFEQLPVNPQQIILTDDTWIGNLLVAHTNHTVYFSESVLTPEFEKRVQEAQNMLHTDSTQPLRDTGIRWLVLQVGNVGLKRGAWRGNPEQFHRLDFGNDYDVGQITGELSEKSEADFVPKNN